MTINEKNIDEQLDNMIQSIQSSIKISSACTGVNAVSPEIIKAIRVLPRHYFLKSENINISYCNEPIFIGYGQTTSQPSIIVIMIELLHVRKDDKVLEIGTGSGFQTAILSMICKEVYTIEIIPQLLEDALEKLQKLGIKNIHGRIGNGAYGWKENSPFDKIIVSAACNEIPKPLIEQLKPNGIIVLPLDTGEGFQELVVIKKDKNGMIHKKKILPVRFVPLLE